MFFMVLNKGQGKSESLVLLTVSAVVLFPHVQKYALHIY